MTKFRSLLIKLRTWWTRFRLSGWWTKFWGWVGDNFIIVAAALLFLGLATVWTMFRRGFLDIETFKAYAMYSTAAGTGLLALATVFMARKNHKLTELTRRSLEKPVIAEIIVNAIEPVAKRLEQDADAIESGRGLYLYDISMPHLSEPPRTLYDIKTILLGDIFGLYPHYWEVIRRYSDFENYLESYAHSLSKAQCLIEQTLHDIEICIGESSLAKVVAAFPPNSRIPLKYLPFWELLATSGKTTPQPGYDKFSLWSPEVQSFWQNHKEEIMAIIHTNEGFANAINDINKALKQCQDILVAKFKRLNKVKGELKGKYYFTDAELESLRAQDKKHSNVH